MAADNLEINVQYSAIIVHSNNHERLLYMNYLPYHIQIIVDSVYARNCDVNCLSLNVIGYGYSMVFTRFPYKYLNWQYAKRPCAYDKYRISWTMPNKKLYILHNNLIWAYNIYYGVTNSVETYAFSWRQY